MKKKNIILTGFRGCGKKEFGKALGVLTGLPFVDIDSEVEFLIGEPIFDFVEKYGWQVYREIEQKVAHDFCRNFSGIISTGDGTIENSKNLENLKKTGHFVFVNPNFSDVKKKLLEDKGIILFPRLNADLPLAQEIDQLWQQRKSIYQAISETEVNPNLHENIAQEAQKIEHILKNVLPNAPEKKKLAILADTRDSLFQGLIDAQSKGRIPNAIFELFITDNPKAPTLKVAQDLPIPHIEVLENKSNKASDEYDRQIINILRKHNPDFVLVLHWAKNLSTLYSEQFGNISLSAYQSLHSKYATLNDLEIHDQIIDNEDRYTGCTICKISTKTDTTENVLQRKILIDEQDTPETLQSKIEKQEVLAFCEVLERR